MNVRLATAIVLLSQTLPVIALAQPALDRVEKQLRRQSPVRVAAAGDSDSAEEKNPGYLGIIGDDRQDTGKGVRVMRIDPAGAAEKGGMKVGDLITTIDQAPIQSMDDLGELLSRQHAGSVLKFMVDRNGDTRELQVRLLPRPVREKQLLPGFGKQDEDMPAPAAGGPTLGGPSPGPAAPSDGGSVILNTRRPKLGIRTEHLTAFMREQSRLPGSYVAGVFVSYVDPEAPAGRAGLPTGAIITSVDGAPIDSPDTLKTIIDRAGPGQALTMTYYHRDHESQAVVTLAGGPSRPGAAGPQPTVRAKPVSPTRPTPEQPPGFAPDESAAPSDGGAAPNGGAMAKTIADLERRIGELERRVAELEAAAIVPGAPAVDSEPDEQN